MNKGRLHAKSYTVCGTPEYLSPELVLSKGHDKSVDYWALGCLIFELFTGGTPFQDDFQQNIFRKIINSKDHIAVPDGVNPHLGGLCQRLLEPDPAFRLGSLNGGVTDIKNHHLFAGINWDGLVKKEIQPPFIPSITSALDTSNFDVYEEEDDIIPFHGDQALFANF